MHGRPPGAGAGPGRADRVVGVGLRLGGGAFGAPEKRQYVALRVARAGSKLGVGPSEPTPQRPRRGLAAHLSWRRQRGHLSLCLLGNLAGGRDAGEVPEMGVG